MQKKIPTTRDLKIFGLIWGVILTFVFYKSGSVAVLCVAMAFFLVSIAFPQVFLHIKLYQLWIKFGDFLGKINGLLISFILFYGVFAPAGFILRLLKKDLLSKKLDKARRSYFIDRKEQPNNMKNQF